MTLVSIFFNENDDFKSFSQLLAGTLVAPEQQSSPGELDGGEFKPMFTGLTSTPLDLTYYELTLASGTVRINTTNHNLLRS